ncbi:MAG: dihydropteroate synthase [Fidelibacterota bacterium]|nr:MAG: dihydropteroate synthase [Candidatus Neomarinimicrobiota bacterium]
MSIPGLTLIGESINDSVPSTHALFEASDIDAIIELARMQAEKGAAYIDVNVGRRAPAFMVEVVRKIQEHIDIPLSIDTPDPEIAAAGLEAYDAQRAGNQKPILNSISEARLEMFDLYTRQPFIPIMLTTESVDDSGEGMMNKTAEATYATARTMVSIARERIGQVSNEDLILDPGIMPIGSDTEGHFKRLMNTIELIHGDEDLHGIQMSVGLSNFTVMLPPKTSDGVFVRSTLESAFLTMAMPLGLRTIIGSVKRKYRILDNDHPALICLREVVQLDGTAALIRVMSYCS